MRRLTCDSCSSPVSFEQSACARCGRELAFDRSAGRMTLLAEAVGQGGALCANFRLNGCNWLAEPSSSYRVCHTCELIRTRPSDDDAAGMREYRLAVAALRRLVFGLDALTLPTPVSDGYVGIAVDLLSSSAHPVTTGYANGVITIDVAEADHLARTKRQTTFFEPYRTMLGHLRHEFGHYYLEILALTTDSAARFRGVFGDPDLDYREALDRHYRDGPPSGWSQSYISRYASMHPKEDFAECFAHYLLIQDTLQTASQWGMIDGTFPDLSMPGKELVGHWGHAVDALNDIGHSMGHDDLYPFALTEPVLAKLEMIVELVRSAARD